MANEPQVPHAVVAAMRMAGPQRSSMTVHHGGTPEAFVTVSIGRSVIYMHSRLTTERFGAIWREAQREALRLPWRRALRVGRPEAEPLDIAEPSIVVHAAGQPAASVRLAQLPSDPMPTHLSVHIGNLSFLIYDQRAFASCAEVFLRAAAAGREQLGQADLRRAWVPAMRGEPALAGHDAERAAQSLAHPPVSPRALLELGAARDDRRVGGGGGADRGEDDPRAAPRGRRSGRGRCSAGSPRATQCRRPGAPRQACGSLPPAAVSNKPDGESSGSRPSGRAGDPSCSCAAAQQAAGAIVATAAMNAAATHSQKGHGCDHLDRHQRGDHPSRTC